ncbi:MAG: hypothetical protein IPQ26_09545 [Elusimicrobia bacterium]|nr:hypothetical protein [Elusimicrobiota bacterium]
MKGRAGQAAALEIQSEPGFPNQADQFPARPGDEPIEIPFGARRTEAQKHVPDVKDDEGLFFFIHRSEL